MAKEGEEFTKGESVVWDHKQIDAAQGAWGAPAGEALQYKDEPLLIIEAHEAKAEGRILHPQSVVVCLENNPGIQIPLSGRWLTHRKH